MAFALAGGAIGAGLLGSGLGIGTAFGINQVTGGGDIKGKSATDRRIREQYQTLVKDLRLAGLNPSLAYGSASATSTASGTALQAASTSGSGGLGEGVHAFAEYSLLGAQKKLVEEQGKNVKENTGKQAAERQTTEAGLPRARLEGKIASEAEDAVDKIRAGGGNTNDLWDGFKRWMTGERTSAVETKKRKTTIKGRSDKQRRPTKPKSKGALRSPTHR